MLINLTNDIDNTLITLAHSICCMFTFFFTINARYIAIRNVNPFNTNKKSLIHSVVYNLAYYKYSDMFSFQYSIEF